MIAVMFEVKPKNNKMDEYLALASELNNYLETIDGFISIERFSSLSDKHKLLSLSFWRDEESVKQWRNLEAHRAMQTKGRESIFENYRLRVATVDRDYSLQEREQVPKDSHTYHHDKLR